MYSLASLNTVSQLEQRMVSSGQWAMETLGETK